MEQINHLRKIRQSRLLGKTELARMAGLSLLTIDRIEKGKSCRLSTQRKILLALGLKMSQRNRVFKSLRNRKG